ncbi:MAG: PQQ-binding-like beta-propeller repeat protein [Thermoanaerobaculia bacterium]|nr:PQQ-binding-like beta-propeller repeat protein [Thermoanaerobaculia bacterium]
MIAPRADRPAAAPPNLRLWPGVVLVALQWLGRFIVPFFLPDAMPYGVMGALALGLLVVLWWVFLSRAPRGERWGGLLLMVAAMFGFQHLVDPSIATGMMGMMFPIYALPGLCLALVVWAVLTRNIVGRARLVTLALTIFGAFGVWTLVRTGGFSGDLDHEFAWRWAESHEDRVVAQQQTLREVAADLPGVTGPAEWPGFRGSARDSVVRHPRYATDWSVASPEEVWRRDIGPGWGSFAVRGDLIYTQEQRGEEEVVACYRLSFGEPVWRHGDPVRFWESNAGAGPRATPTIDGDQIFALGGTGLINALRAHDGEVIWSRDAAADTGTTTPMWGYSASPLVSGDLAVVAASGRLVAYDRHNGDLRWMGPEATTSYSSPHWATLHGEGQILHLNGEGILSFEPETGEVLWRHDWDGYPIVQPAVTSDGDVLLAVSEGDGLRRLQVRRAAAGWQAQERWTSIRLKPYFNDFVVHEGHAYGFDGSIMAAIDITTGDRVWKGGRYGNGQLVLLAEQDLLLVLSEDGELVLVGATPDGHSELSRAPALTGRTWNHPVVVGDLVLVRNGKEMAAFRLPV